MEDLNKLRSELEEKNRLLDQLKREQKEEETLKFSWTGNLGHWYWDVKSNRVTFNDLKIKALGFDPDDVPENIGFEFFTEKLHPEDYKAVMQNMRDHLEGRTPVYETEYRIKTKEGSWKHFYDRGSITQRSEEGAPLLVAGIVFDITERKNYEKKQQQLLESLAEELQLKEKLFSIIFHDVKGPIGTMLGFATLLVQRYNEYSPETLKKYLENIRELAEKTNETTEYLMTWLRTQASDDALVQKEFELFPFISSILQEFKIIAQKKQLILKNRVPSEVSIISHKIILAIALRNLLSNAIKFTPSGKHINLSFSEKTDRYSIAVADQGKGMTNERVTNLFTSNNTSTPGTDNEEGHGFGLLIVKDLLLKVGCDIRVDSEPDAGSTFTIDIPKK